MSRLLYLHGFASGPGSKKGVAFTKHFGGRAVIERMDLRVPSFPHLRLSAMIETVRAAMTGRTILIGSSLGGLTAARVAERDDRVEALVLLAPAFRLAQRWHDQLGATAIAAWQRTGWREVLDRTTNAPAQLDYGFLDDIERVDVGFPDVRVPTLIVHGTRDDAVPIDHSRQFAHGRSHVRLVELDDDHELVASLSQTLAEADAFLAPRL
jgi:hypothetical protein